MLTSFFVAAPNKPTAELSNTAQRKWIKQVYETLGMKFSKVTHAGRGSGSRIAEGLNIEEDQICRAGCWNTDSIIGNLGKNYPLAPAIEAHLATSMC